MKKKKLKFEVRLSMNRHTWVYDTYVNSEITFFIMLDTDAAAVTERVFRKMYKLNRFICDDWSKYIHDMRTTATDGVIEYSPAKDSEA